MLLKTEYSFLPFASGSIRRLDSSATVVQQANTAVVKSSLWKFDRPRSLADRIATWIKIFEENIII